MVVMLRDKQWDRDWYSLRRNLHSLSRRVHYKLGSSAREIDKNMPDLKELGKIKSEKEQQRILDLDLRELMETFFFRNYSSGGFNIFPEYRSDAMGQLESLIVSTLETIPTEKEIKERPPANILRVEEGEEGTYVLSNHRFRKYGQDYDTGIKVHLDSSDIGTLLFAADHPGSGSPVVYPDYRIVENNVPDKANAYIVGGIKRVSLGEEVPPHNWKTQMDARRFMWSPISADTQVAPVNLPRHVEDWEGFCIVPVKYLHVDEKILEEVKREKTKQD